MREKTFTNWKENFRGTVYMGVAIDIAHAHACHAPKKFVGKTFVVLHKSAKFVKVFSLESFLLYSK